MTRSNLRATSIAVAMSVPMMAVDAIAAPITYGFRVEAKTGGLAGITADGSMSFDDSMIPIGGGIVRGGPRLTELDFFWDGIPYDETAANTGGLVFDSAGVLIEALFGTACGDAYCIGGSVGNPFGWVVAGDNFFYTHPGDPFGGSGTVQFSRVSNGVPEPTTLALLGLGLLGLTATRRRQS